MSIPIAKHMPWAGAITAVLMPITRPAPETKGPPELPGLSGASVWMTLSSRLPARVRRVRPRALTIPAVTVQVKPSRIADGNHQLTDFQRCGGAEFGIGQTGAGQTQDGDVG